MKKARYISDIISQKDIAKSFRRFADDIEKGSVKIIDIKHKRDRKHVGCYNTTIILQDMREVEEVKKHSVTFPALTKA